MAFFWVDKKEAPAYLSSHHHLTALHQRVPSIYPKIPKSPHVPSPSIINFSLFFLIKWIIVMSLVFTRQIHYKRLPNYSGWWTQILKQAENPIEQSIQEQTDTGRKVPLPIPFAEVIEPTQPIITNVKKPKVFVHLKGTPIELPEKPEPPENCCMR